MAAMKDGVSKDTAPGFAVRLARDARDLRAAQRLRYAVFVQELGARCAGADHAARLESDAFDAHVDHLLLIDAARDAAGAEDHVIGVYRLLPDTVAARLGRFYSDAEYDLTPLRASGRRLVELGRSCVHPAHRRGAAMLHLWNGLAAYVIAGGFEVLFGVASFPGADPAPHAPALAWLHAHHRAPEGLRVRVLPGPSALRMEGAAAGATPAAIPPLIRAYLRLGGTVGEGAFVDRDFNTTDVFLMVDTSAMSGRAFDFYTRKTPRL